MSHALETTAVGATEARQLLADLVAIPSPSGEEDECARRLVEFFESHGREAWRDEVGNVRAPGDDAVLLTSHVDTVPGEIPVEVAPAEPDRIEDGEPADALWGRGSVDAKGPLAALAVAAVRSGASFAGVVREETDSRGARHLVADRAEPDAVINGEPSGWDGITLGYRGFLPGTYSSETPSGHTSRPDDNAIQHAMAWWADVEAAFDDGNGDDERANGDDDPAVFETVTPKPVAVEGGTAEDGLSMEASVEFQVRVPPGEGIDAVRTTIESLVEEGTVEWDDAATIPALMADPRNPVATAFRAAIRADDGEPRMLRKTGTADANLYGEAWDCPVVTYGPGDSSLDHAPNEHLPLVEFDRAVAVLETVTRRLTTS